MTLLADWALRTSYEAGLPAYVCGGVGVGMCWQLASTEKQEAEGYWKRQMQEKDSYWEE